MARRNLMPAEVLERILTLDNEDSGDDSQRDTEMITSDGENKIYRLSDGCRLHVHVPYKFLRMQLCVTLPNYKASSPPYTR